MRLDRLLWGLVAIAVMVTSMRGAARGADDGPAGSTLLRLLEDNVAIRSDIAELRKDVAGLREDVQKALQSPGRSKAVQTAKTATEAKGNASAGPLSTAELATFAEAYARSPGRSFTDVNPRSGVWRHLIQHGFSANQVNGLTQHQALWLHAAAHAGRANSHAVALPENAPIAKASQPTVTRRVIPRSNCANGNCARQYARAYSWGDDDD